MLLARELTAHLDAAQDHRLLAPPEVWLLRELKRAYLGFASVERSIAHLPARFSWLREGDTNSTFFKIHSVHRRQKLIILGVQSDGGHILASPIWPGRHMITSLPFLTLLSTDSLP